MYDLTIFRKGGWVVISNKKKTKYQVEKAGKHKFRLVCCDDDCDTCDKDVTFVKIFKCKGTCTLMNLTLLCGYVWNNRHGI